jgi:hypothetical protein
MVMLFAFVACSDSHDRSPGSQTHFLDSCEDSCAAPYACICGVCTVQCSKDAQCSGHASDAQCTSARPDDDAQCGGDAPVCDVTCSGDGDCVSLGDGFTCSAGRCRMAPKPIVTGAHDAGSDAAAMIDTGAHDSGPITTDSGTGVPICNGGKGFRLGVFDSGTGLLPPNPTGHFLQVYGGPFVVLGADCHFYASLNPMAGIVTGTLSAKDEAQLASDVDWNMFTTYGQFAKSAPNCQDGGGYITGDGSHSFACLCNCDPAAPPSLERARDASVQWLMRLAGDGMGVEGAVSAVATVFSGGTPPPGDPQAWPLSTPITDIVTADENDLGDGKRFDDPSDAKALRAMRSKALADFPDARQIFATDGTQKYLVYVRDELDVATDLSIVQFRSAVLTSSP